MKIIGRKEEQHTLYQGIESKAPEFVAVYGRRRVGKTFLVREYFHDNFAFHLTGTSGESMRVQLGYFDTALKKYGASIAATKTTGSWHEAFERLTELLEKTKIREQGKRVVFFDELAWLDTPRSGFLSALEHFWNDWGASQPDLVLVVCGSASSWIIKRIFKNRGGLHNRVTRRIRLSPFTIRECADFFLDRGIDYDKKSLADAYMVFGGIPFYLNLFQRGKSVSQNVDALCFAENAPLADEFEELYKSLFKNADKHIAIVKALASKRKGVTRDEIIAQTGLRSGGGLTDMLEELEQSGFLIRYDDFSGKADRYLYRLTDFFSYFYLLYLAGRRRKDSQFWTNARNGGAYNTWAGNTFELLCLVHIDRIKEALGISGVSTTVSTWRDPAQGSNAQIDLIIDRNDGVIDLCEMKYSIREFVIDKAYAEILEKRKFAFVRGTRTKKTIHTVLVAAEGLKTNLYSHTVQTVLTLEDLF